MIRHLVLAAMSCCVFPATAGAQQLAPNPNPSGNTITVTANRSNSEHFRNLGTIDVQAAGSLLNNQALDNSGVITHTGGIGNAGTVNNTGTINSHNEFVIFPHATLDNDGTINNHVRAINNGGSVFNFGTYNNYGPLLNYGSWRNTTTGTLNNWNFIINNGTLVNNGTVDTSGGTLVNNGTLSGSGKIIGNTEDAGTYAPGESAGIHTHIGHWNKTGGRTEIELGGTFDGGGDKSLAEYDRIEVTGDVHLAGRLVIDLINGHRPGSFRRYRIVEVGGTRTGKFRKAGEGRIVSWEGRLLLITYRGGDGNDVELFTTHRWLEPVIVFLPRKIRYWLVALVAGW